MENTKKKKLKSSIQNLKKKKLTSSIHNLDKVFGMLLKHEKIVEQLTLKLLADNTSMDVYGALLHAKGYVNGLEDAIMELTEYDYEK